MRSRIDRLGEDVYDHLLREAGDYTNPGEWYEIAVGVVERLKKLIVQSREVNMAVFRPQRQLSSARRTKTIGHFTQRSKYLGSSSGRTIHPKNAG